MLKLTAIRRKALRRFWPGLLAGLGLASLAGCVDVTRAPVFSANCGGRTLTFAIETRESISVTLYDYLLLIDDVEADRLGGELGRKSLPVNPAVRAAIPRRNLPAPPDDALAWQVYLNPARHTRADFDAISACLVARAGEFSAAVDQHPLAERALEGQLSDPRRLAIGAVLYADYARLSERYCHTENPTLCVHVAPGGEVSLEEQTRDRFSMTFLGRTPDGRTLHVEVPRDGWLGDGADPARFQNASGRSLSEAYRIE